MKNSEASQGGTEHFAVIRREVQYDAGIRIVDTAQIVALTDDLSAAESLATQFNESGYSRENHDGGDTPNDALWFEATKVVTSGLMRAIAETTEYKTVSGDTLTHTEYKTLD